MRRWHLFEFNDQGWLPRFMTAWMTRIMRLGHMQLENGKVWGPKLTELLQRGKTSNIVDLCSGGGGPILDVSRILEDQYNLELHITLTDIIPNLQTASDINQKGDKIRYVTDPIDASSVPACYKGVRTVFSGLHHLKDTVVVSFLQNAFDSRQCIFIGETTHRSWKAIKAFGVAAKYFFPMTKFIFPTPLQRFFTYFVPILPLMLGWDNVISCLRTYSTDELKEFTSKFRSNDYIWEIGELKSPKFDHPFTYLMGYPRVKTG